MLFNFQTKQWNYIYLEQTRTTKQISACCNNILGGDLTRNDIIVVEVVTVEFMQFYFSVNVVPRGLVRPVRVVHLATVVATCHCKQFHESHNAPTGNGIRQG